MSKKEKSLFVMQGGHKVICPSAVFIRSQLELGGYCDDELNTEPSMTDPSQDEPIEKLVARLMRGEISARSPEFDVESGVDPDSAIAAMSDTEKDGFDLADAAAIAARGKNALDEVKKAKASPKPAKVAEKPKEEAPEPPKA